ncbi:MAG: IclR family transcriptional regulator [Pseudolabrys sp.]|nr:IclR family transcriptional regulator [Pseudolabrys sp.]
MKTPARKSTADKLAKPGAMSQTVSRAIAILKVFDRDRRELGITEIAKAVELPKTIVFRLIQTLRHHDLLEQNPETTKYRIGFGAFEIGNLFKSATLESESAPLMRQLVDETGHTAQLAVLHHAEMIIVGRMEGRGPVKYGVSVGERRSLHSSAVGKAVLSAMSEQDVADFVAEVGLKKRTPNTIIEERSLRADLAKTRERGYSVNWEENTVGVASLAAPILSRHSNTVAAIALAFPANPAVKKDLPRLGKLLSAAAATLSARI